MNKETSTIIKGVAILMMLFYHLFGRENLTEICTPLLYIGNTPLVRYITNACYPVSFFMILSGYGLTYCYKKNQLNPSIQGKRILKLYVHYWLVLLIFVTIGHFIKPDIYPNNLIHILINITGIKCTYNGEIWFLLPYTIITMLSWWIINFVYNLNDKRKIFITLVVYSVIFLTARYIGYHLPKNEIIATLLIQLVYIVQLTFYFSLGILLFRLLENEPTALKAIKPTTYFIIIIALFIIKSMIKVTIADGLYAFIIIFCISHLQLHRLFHNIFYKLGQYSMPMWMTHTFFAVYLFQDFIYGFKYPLLIWLVLIAISYLVSIPILKIGNRINNLIFK